MRKLNQVLEDMVLQNRLSNEKVAALSSLKVFVDRVAGNRYLPEEEEQRLELKFGVKPDIITWGDYFQERVADAHWELSDDEFNQIIETIRFDIVSAALIFEGKETEFLETVHENRIKSELLPEDERESHDYENIHLGILCGYYSEMNLNTAALNEADLSWFENFSVRAVS